MPVHFFERPKKWAKKAAHHQFLTSKILASAGEFLTKLVLTFQEPVPGKHT